MGARSQRLRARWLPAFVAGALAAPDAFAQLEGAVPPGYTPILRHDRVEYRYDPRLGVPPGYEVEARPRTGLLVAGSVVFGTVYLLTTIGAAQESGGPDAGSANWLYVPVLGPFVAAARVDRTRLCQAYSNGDESRLTNTYRCNQGVTGAYLMLGAAELAGAGLFALGFSLSKKWLVPSPDAGLSLAPVQLGSAGLGLAVNGRF